jgi:hypothetical protein
MGKQNAHVTVSAIGGDGFLLHVRFRECPTVPTFLCGTPALVASHECATRKQIWSVYGLRFRMGSTFRG